MTRLFPTLALTLSLMLVVTQAAAHPGHGAHSGFVSGFFHPILGLDHVIAMLAVGLWAARLGGASVWVLPVVFPLVMAFGAALGLMGVALPAVEAGIALSGVVLGLIIAVALRAPVAVAAAIVGGFAVFHGHAHGTELPGGVGVSGYALGFLMGTGLLHLAGIGLAGLMRGAIGARALQGTGAGIAMLGGAAFIGLA
jgi:urease accessory protein